LASKFQQTTNESPPKNSKKFQTFQEADIYAEFKYEEKNDKQIFLNRGKIQFCHAFTKTRLFSMVSSFFCGSFLYFPQMFCTQYKILHAEICILNLVQKHFY